MVVAVGLSELFNILCEHYKAVHFEPSVYLLVNPFLTIRSEFYDEQVFRETLFTKKPLFIANRLDRTTKFVADLDFKFTEFTDQNFAQIYRASEEITRALESAFNLKDYELIFSGSGLHYYAYFEELDEIREHVEKYGALPGVNPFLKFYELVNKVITDKVSSSVASLLDTTTLAGNKVMRTPLSVHNKTLLPVVPLPKDRPATIDDVINYLKEPLRLEVTLRRRAPVRVGGTVSLTKEATIDQYEFIRLFIYNNYALKTVKVV